jgi:hypothetical protein
MKQQHIDRIKKLVADDGLSNALKLLGGNKDIIRKTYIDNPISYMDLYLNNLQHTQTIHTYSLWYNYKTEIFTYFKDYPEVIYVNDFIWNYFYKSIMQFDDIKIELLILQWLYKHHPSLSMTRLKVLTDYEIIQRKWISAGLHTETIYYDRENDRLTN